MPELPDVVAYIHALAPRVVGHTLGGVRLGSPFVLRSFAPPIAEVDGKRVVGLRRIGKRIVLVLDGDLFLVIHLMVSGRLHWKERPAAVSLKGKMALAAFDFDSGTLLLTEASSKKRASIHVVRGEEALAAFSRGGLEVLESDRDAFASVLRRENHTLKRALTDPRLFSGIGNAYSDEILHRARLSPAKLTSAADGSGDRPARFRHAARARNVDRAIRRGSGEGVSGKGHGVSRGDGGSRPLRQAVPRLRHARATHRLRGERGELLREVSDGREASRRPSPVAAASRRLAPDTRGVGGEEERGGVSFGCRPADPLTPALSPEAGERGKR